MALTVTLARVKEKCSLTGTTYDSTITNLINEMAPVIEYAIRDEHLNDTGNAKLQNTLSLGATEIVCAEILEQLQREAGALESVRLGDFALSPPEPADWPGALSMKDSGWKRLRPYLKPDPSGKAGAIAGGGSKKE